MYTLLTRKILFICVAATLLLSANRMASQAAIVTTSVTTGNNKPAFSVLPFESPVSTIEQPLNAGDSITFQATAEDPTGESYYLIICSSENVIPGEAGASPTCLDDIWCVSELTASGASASCTYTTGSANSGANDWYAFACDNSSFYPSCSDLSQGLGDSASPFAVNEAADFSSISNNSPSNPGGSITWLSNASDDGDIKLLICKTDELEEGECSGGEWCSSSFSADDPSCTANLPTPMTRGSHEAYAYIIDSFGLEAAGQQGASSHFEVNNTAPVVSAVELNSGADINLAAMQTTPVQISAIVTDNNGCENEELSLVAASLYRSGIGMSGCDGYDNSDANHCYSEISCTPNPGSCSGNDDASAEFICTANVQFFADPTDYDTEYSSENWLAFVKADDGLASDTAESAAGININSLTALAVTNSVSYGTVEIGAKIDPLSKLIEIENAGNVPQLQEVSGSDMTQEEEIIAAENQRWSESGSTPFNSGNILSGEIALTQNHLEKTNSVLLKSIKNIWWGIQIPLGTQPGVYIGNNTITAIKFSSP